MDRRLWGVLVAGVAIAGVCGWRLATNRPQDYEQQLQSAHVLRPAPDFEALDENNRMFRLQRYLGRHRVLVVFFDAELTAAGDPILQGVRAAYPALQRQDIQVVGVSSALPQHNRAAVGAGDAFPFPLVTDLDLKIHDRWGRIDPVRKGPLPGLFLVDRKGAVPCFGPTPQPATDWQALLTELTHP